MSNSHQFLVVLKSRKTREDIKKVVYSSFNDPMLVVDKVQLEQNCQWPFWLVMEIGSSGRMETVARAFDWIPAKKRKKKPPNKKK